MEISPRFRVPTMWFAVFVAIATLWISSSAASAGSSKAWTITEMSGRVNIVRSGAAPVALTSGDELRPGDMIETAADSGAILVRNGESIVVAPNSRMGLPAANDSGFATLILQQLGTLLLKVEKRSRRHFEVKTPYLVAIVKGTTFSVTVDSQGASVHVLEGAVQVANKTGMVALVRPGRTAVVSSKPGSGLSIQGGAVGAPARPGDSAKNETGAGSGAPDVASNAAPHGFVIRDTVGTASIDIAAATNGLIHVAQTPGRVGAATSGQGGDATGRSGLAVTADTLNRGADHSTESSAGAGGAVGGSGGNSGNGPAAAGNSGNGPVAAGNPGNGPVGAGNPGNGPVGAGNPGNGPVGAGNPGNGPVGAGNPGNGPVGAGNPGNGPAVPGPVVSVPAAPGPVVSVPAAPGPAVSVPAAPGPAVSVPAVPGPAVSGPVVSVPAAPGPAVSGPVVSVPAAPVPAAPGPAVSGPVVSVPAVPGPTAVGPTVVAAGAPSGGPAAAGKDKAVVPGRR